MRRNQRTRVAPVAPPSSRPIARATARACATAEPEKTTPGERPAGSGTFFKQAEVTSSGAWQTVVEHTVPEGMEGRLLEAAGADVAGSVAVEWRLTVGGSPPADMPPWKGIWSALDRPRSLVVFLKGGDRIALECKVAGSLKVQASLYGFTHRARHGRGPAALGEQR